MSLVLTHASISRSPVVPNTRLPSSGSPSDASDGYVPGFTAHLPNPTAPTSVKCRGLEVRKIIEICPSWEHPSPANLKEGPSHCKGWFGWLCGAWGSKL